MDAVGKRGEDEACLWLAAKGHQVLERNWRGGHCEIDIITADSAGLHFVEVKSRKAPVAADPLVNVTAAKQKHLVQAALKYLHSGGRRYADAEVNFDIVTVVFNEDNTEIEYYPQAFIPIYD
ncbi:MAG: YraN family protein [Bacteroidales bacterium]|nr:YraN family protein [Bacteroidales bacterium]